MWNKIIEIVLLNPASLMVLGVVIGAAGAMIAAKLLKPWFKKNETAKNIGQSVYYLFDKYTDDIKKATNNNDIAVLADKFIDGLGKGADLIDYDDRPVK